MTVSATLACLGISQCIVCINKLIMSVLFLLYKHDTIQHQNNLIHFLSLSYFLYIFKNVKKEINIGPGH